MDARALRAELVRQHDAIRAWIDRWERLRDPQDHAFLIEALQQHFAWEESTLPPALCDCLEHPAILRDACAGVFERLRAHALREETRALALL